jgi:hypothetical protein
MKQDLEVSTSQPRPQLRSRDDMVTMRHLVCVVIAAQLIVSVADAHSWYPKECCSDQDCQPVPCAEITRTHLGLKWRDHVFFAEWQTHDSKDQFCHVCVKSYDGSMPYVPICVFVPRVTS